METYLLDWVNLLLRWLHVIVAIAWIGSSFYFVWLDDHLQPPVDDDLKARGVDGELWAVHGGGFYNPQKYRVGPKRMPGGTLHWFYWESYATWLSGMALFIVLYLWNARSFLVAPGAIESPLVAGLAALAFLAGGWVVYDLICRRAGRQADGSVGHDGRVLVLVAVFVAAAAWLACRWFPGRAAFLIVGAMLATIMSANVAMCIIPGQRKVVAALQAGQVPDPAHGQRGKQRSLHNTYFTLPVLVAMISNHYSHVTQHAWNWLALIGLMAVGVLVRLFFVLRHQGPPRWRLVVAVLALLLGLGLMLAPAPATDTASAAPPPGVEQALAVVQQRCVLCHNAQLAQKGIALHTSELLKRHAALVYQQTVLLRQMPLNNATQITEAERRTLQRWFEAGAPGP